jgi:hypothetical protein
MVAKGLVTQELGTCTNRAASAPLILVNHKFPLNHEIYLHRVLGKAKFDFLLSLDSSVKEEVEKLCGVATLEMRVNIPGR